MEEICADYLRNMTPTAQKIAEDIDRIRNSHNDIWEKLDTKDRNHLIDKALIDSQLAVVYAKETNKEMQSESLSNFSWFTKSQLNLFKYIDIKPTSVLSPVKRMELALSPKIGQDTVDATKEIPPVPVHKSKSMTKSPSSEEKTVNEIKIKSHPPTKPKTPPPPPPSKLVANEKSIPTEDPNNMDDIPKTGFDFLDNW